MRLYRLLTERKNVKTIIDFVNQEFGGFTVYETTGYWQGKKEKALCIEIGFEVVTADIPQRINALCKAICSFNNQQCVMVQIVDVECQLIGQSGVL